MAGNIYHPCSKVYTTAHFPTSRYKWGQLWVQLHSQTDTQAKWNTYKTQSKFLMTLVWHTTGHKRDPILMIHIKANSAEQQAQLSQLWPCCEDLAKAFTSSSLLSHVLLKHIANSSFCQKLDTGRKGLKDLKMDWTHNMIRPSRSLCVCVMWKTVKLELEGSLGSGLTWKYGYRHLVFSQPLSCCESLQTKASWFLPLLLSQGWTEWAQALCPLLSVGWGELGWVPRSDLGGLEAFWLLSSFQTFFSSWT